MIFWRKGQNSVVYLMHLVDLKSFSWILFCKLQLVIFNIAKTNLDKPEKIKSKVKVQRSKVKVKAFMQALTNSVRIDCVRMVLKNQNEMKIYFGHTLLTFAF